MKETMVSTKSKIRRCKLLEVLNYRSLIIFSVILGLAPFYPMPHIVEKLMMLSKGTLVRPIDIFDLFFHAAPILLLAAKYLTEKNTKG
jgi:hypothetical protein